MYTLDNASVIPILGTFFPNDNNDSTNTLNHPKQHAKLYKTKYPSFGVILNSMFSTFEAGMKQYLLFKVGNAQILYQYIKGYLRHYGKRSKDDTSTCTCIDHLLALVDSLNTQRDSVFFERSFRRKKMMYVRYTSKDA
jgi:hypothetical protein